MTKHIEENKTVPFGRMNSNRFCSDRILTIAISLVALGAPERSLADNSLAATASADQRYVSNILGTNDVPSGFSKSDYISRLSAGFLSGFDIGRQQLLLTANGGTERHALNSILDSNFYDALGTANWKARVNCEGTSSVESSSNQSDLREQNAPVSNQIDNLMFNNQAGCLLRESYKLGVEFNYSTSDNSAAIEKVSDRNEVHGIVSFDYVTPRPASLGVKIGYVQRDYPNRDSASTTLATQVDEYDGIVALQYTLSPKTSFSLQSGIAQIEAHAFIGAATTEYPTVDADLKWQPTAKTLVDLEGSQKIGAADTIDSSYTLQRMISLSVENAVTTKLNISLLTSYIERDLNGSAASFDLPSDRVDDLASATVGVNYSLTDSIIASASVGYVNQSSNDKSATYGSEIVLLGLKAKFDRPFLRP
jgi:hypothetical protein